MEYLSLCWICFNQWIPFTFSRSTIQVWTTMTSQPSSRCLRGAQTLPCEPSSQRLACPYTLTPRATTAQKAPHDNPTRAGRTATRRCNLYTSSRPTWNSWKSPLCNSARRFNSCAVVVNNVYVYRCLVMGPQSIYVNKGSIFAICEL